MDSHRNAHDPGASSGRNTTATTEAIRRGLGCGKVHPELTADSDAWPAGAKVDVGRVTGRRPAPGSPGATPTICRPATSCAGRLRCAIRVDRVSHEDANAEQPENRGKSLNHLTHPYCTVGNV
jgi:hypothetical protein